MTRIAIFETPENREEYAKVPCAFNVGGIMCGERLANHGRIPLPEPFAGDYRTLHDWRIYREAPMTLGIADSIKFATTAIPTTAAEPAGAVNHPETATYASGPVSAPSDAGVEREQAARPRTSRYLVLADDGNLYDYERPDVLRLHLAEHRSVGESPRQIFRLVTPSLVVAYEPIAEDAIV